MADVTKQRTDAPKFTAVVWLDRISIPVFFFWFVIAAVVQVSSSEVASAMSLGALVCLVVLSLIRLVLLVRAPESSPTTRLLGYSAPLIVGLTALVIWLTRK